MGRMRRRRRRRKRKEEGERINEAKHANWAEIGMQTE